MKDPPPDAKAIFDVVRLLPPSIALADEHAVYERFCREDPDGRVAALQNRPDRVYDAASKTLSPEDVYRSDGEFEVALKCAYGFYRLRSLEECLQGLPDSFVHYVDPPSERTIRKYRKYVESRYPVDFKFAEANYPQFLESLVYKAPTDDAQKRYSDARSWYRRLYFLGEVSEEMSRKGDWSYISYEARTFFRINRLVIREGKIGVEADQFTEAFIGLEISRIRLCGNCGRVFWVKRSGQKGCTCQCSSVLRTRKWREKTTSEQRARYKFNRVRKQLAKGETHGTL